MKFSEIAELILIDSGQFIYTSPINGLDDLGLDITRYWKLVYRCIKEYEKHKPVTRKMNVQIVGQSYNFGDNAPKWISSCVPISSFSLYNAAVFMSMFSSNTTSVNTNSNPRPFLWSYEKPFLYCGENGLVDIVAHYEYEVIPEYELDGDGEPTETIIDYDIPDLGYSESFLDFVAARTLMALARSKRAFTVSDFPVTMDGSELASEATMMLQDISQRLSDKGIWYCGVGS